jgi:hypothetical protein
MKTTNNWKPVVSSLLSKLQKAGCKLITIDQESDPDEWIQIDQTLSPTKQRNAATEELCAVDCPQLLVEMPDGKRGWIHIVLGNGPEEIVADYHCHPVLDRVTEDHSAQWESRKVPQITDKVSAQETSERKHGA